MIGLEFLRHRNRFLARVRRRYFSAEPSDTRKYVCVRRLVFDKRVTFRYVYLFMLVNLIWRTAHQLTEIWVKNSYDIISALNIILQCSSLYGDSMVQCTRCTLYIFFLTKQSNFYQTWVQVIITDFILRKLINWRLIGGRHAIIKIDRSREILSAHFRNSKIQNGSKFLFKLPVIIIIKSWPGVLNLVYY